MPEKLTHREVKKPQISARYLADYMAASEQARRTIARNCKYQPIARVIQHDEAKSTISNFMKGGNPDTSILSSKAQQLRDRLADTDFDRDLYDHNADYIDSFADGFDSMEFPIAEVLPSIKLPSIALSGVKVTAEINFRLQRVTKTNKVKIGAGMLRYSKSAPLKSDVGEWQSALLFGYFGQLGLNNGEEAEQKLCLTVDAHSGVIHCAPSNSLSRFKNMEAACASIAERWPNISAPPNAVYE